MPTEIEALIEKLATLSDEELQEALAGAEEIIGDQIWIPNIGPQTDAFFCEADEMFYGGQAGGGKSDLLVGLSLTQHEKSLIRRRIGAQAA